VTCSPQDWAADSLLLPLQTALGAEPNTTDRKLHIWMPQVPVWLASITILSLKIGETSVGTEYRCERGASYMLMSMGRTNGGGAADLTN